MEANNNYSVFAVNSDPDNSGTDLKALLIEDDLTLPTTGQAHVRFIHLAPDAPAVDIVSAC